MNIKNDTRSKEPRSGAAIGRTVNGAERHQESITAKECVRRAGSGRLGKGNKYKNTPTVVNSIRFASKKEATRYCELKTLEQCGAIRDLTCQVRMPLEINGDRICVYVCDFRYEEKANGSWKKVYEDTKGVRTQLFILKKKLVRALLKIEILET